MAQFRPLKPRQASCGFPVPGDPKKPCKMPGIPPDRHGFLKNRHGFIVRRMNLRRGIKAGNGAVWTTMGRSEFAIFFHRMGLPLSRDFVHPEMMRRRRFSGTGLCQYMEWLRRIRMGGCGYLCAGERGQGQAMSP